MNDQELETLAAIFAVMEGPRGPSVREFQEALGLSSTSLAADRMRRLERAGYIERVTGMRNETRPWRLTRSARARLRTEVLPAYEYALPQSGGGW